MPRLACVMYNLLESIRICTALLQPFMPDSCKKIFEQIGADETVTTWDAAKVWGKLPATVTVHKGEAVFPRVDAEKALAKLEELYFKTGHQTFCKTPADLVSQGEGYHLDE